MFCWVGKMKVPEKLVRLIKIIYKRTETAIITIFGMEMFTDNFRVGLH